jgi:nitrite reductase (NADH) large subunit
MRYVIIGGGVAGITAALDLAKRQVAEIHVYTDEAYPYYYRPQLTEFLAGTLPLNKLLRRPITWYAERGIQIHLSQPVMSIQPEQKTIFLDNGESVAYDKLLIATGSVPFVPPVKGADKMGVRTWRTLADTLELEKAAMICQDVVVIGGGLLGLEAAKGLKVFCGKITVLEFFPRLLPRQLDVEGATLLQSFVESLGIQVIVGAKTEEILGDQRVTGVSIQDGRVISCQTILMAAGVRCNAKLAYDAGIQVDRGIIVNDYMETSVPDIYAAGDTAVYKGYSWAIAPIAQAQARIAVANMVDERVAYDVVVPSTTLKVVGIDVSSVGIVNPDPGTCVELRSLKEEKVTYSKIVLQEGVIIGSIVINDKALAKNLESMISTQQKLSIEEAERLIA